MNESVLGFVDRCLARNPERAPESTACSAALLAWSAGVGLEGFDRIARDLQGAGRQAFQTAARKLSNDWRNDGKIHLASWVCPEILSNQLLPVAQAATSDPRFGHVAVINGAFDRQALGRIGWFLESGFLHAPDISWNRELEFVQVMLGGEASLDASGFPPTTARVLQPHGLDAPLHHSILHFGAGTIYDHVLCPSLDQSLQKDLNPPLYGAIIPKDIREHSSDTLRAIPAGYAKLDKFLRMAKTHRGTPDRIVYHLSNWGLEGTYVHHNAHAILDALLQGFPDLLVMLRPMPKDLHEPEVASLIDKFRHHPRFRLSTADSYVEDYLDAVALVHHRSSSADVFGLATGRPVVLVAPEDQSVRSNEFGPVVRGTVTLVDTLRQALSDTAASSRRQPAAHETLANPGTSIEYILDALISIVSKKRRDDWLAIPLSPVDESPHPTDRLLQAAWNAFVSGVPYRTLARELARRFPTSWTFQFLAAVGLKRDGHPAHYLEYAATWLESIECLSRCYQCPIDAPSGLGLEARFLDWVSKSLPEMLVILEGWATHTPEAQVASRLRRALAAMPLLPGDDSIHQLLFKPKTSSAVPDPDHLAMKREASFLHVSQGVEEFEKGQVATAKTHFQRADELTPGEDAPLIGLSHCAFSQRDRSTYMQLRERLRKTPDGTQAIADLDRLATQIFGAI